MPSRVILAWGGQPGLNRQPPGSQPSALPGELCPPCAMEGSNLRYPGVWNRCSATELIAPACPQRDSNSRPRDP
jgi:hypothetical protein